MRSITKTNPAEVSSRLAERCRSLMDENDRLRALIAELEARTEDPELSWADAVRALR
jgi:hypothetical protein